MNTLIAKHLNGTLDKTGQHKLESWLFDDPANQSLYDDYKLLWEQSEGLRTTYNPDTEKAWKSTHAKLAEHRNTFSWLKIVGIAASILLIGSLVFYLMLPNLNAEFVAHSNIKEPVTLPDGSSVWINKAGKVTYSDVGNTRKVILSGEAFFEVKSDPKKPFLIETGSLTTKVVGTSFNVNAKKEHKVDVTVRSGKVLVYDKKDSVYLLPGFRASYDSQEDALTSSQNTNPNFDAWRTGILVFDNSSMTEVIRLLETHFETSLVGNQNDSLALNATFDNQSLDEILEIIAITTDVEIKIAGDE